LQGLSREVAALLAWGDLEEAFPPIQAAPYLGDTQANMPALTDNEIAAVRGTTSSTADLARDVLWVYEHLGDNHVSATDTPSLGAWGLLRWARSNPTRFFEQLLPKAQRAASGDDSPESADPDLERACADLRRLQGRGL
jgi:hypothetical protein